MRVYQAAAVAAAVCVLAAGCGSQLAHRPAHGHPNTTAHRSSRDASAPTLAGNRKLARTEARRLLARAPVPPGAVRIATVPRSLSMPALGKEAVGTLVDTIRVWRLSVPFWRAQNWLRTHPPHGLPRDG